MANDTGITIDDGMVDRITGYAAKMVDPYIDAIVSTVIAEPFTGIGDRTRGNVTCDLVAFTAGAWPVVQHVDPGLVARDLWATRARIGGGFWSTIGRPWTVAVDGGCGSGVDEARLRAR